MQLDSVVLGGRELALVDSSLVSPHPNLAKQVTVNFTNGKQGDARWGKERDGTFGATFPRDVVVDEAGGVCRGSCLIDLYVILTAAKLPRQTIGRQTIPAKLDEGFFRYLVVVTVVHELFHVAQGWTLGKRFARDMLEEKISAQNRAADYAGANPGMPADPYLQNVFESGARDFVERWKSLHAGAVHQGEFDFLVPIETLRAIFPDKPGAFKNAVRQ